MNLIYDLEQGIRQLGISLDKDAQNKLMNYLSLLGKWNKVYNLTAIRDPRKMVIYHLLDSLAVVPYLWEGQWLDVGCGAGLPGLVLAIARPDWQFTLLDSNSKKISFVQQSIIELQVFNVKVNCIRVEDWQPANLFDGIVSRAYSELGDFINNTIHLMAPQGKWMAMKSAPQEELTKLPDSCCLENIITLQVPYLHAPRSLVIARRAIQID